MATAARKARKRAGIKFEKAQKVGTPIMERSFIKNPVQGPPTTRFQGQTQPRSIKKIAAYLDGRTLNIPVEDA